MKTLKRCICGSVAEPWFVHVIGAAFTAVLFMHNIQLSDRYSLNGVVGTVLQIVGGIGVIRSIDTRSRQALGLGNVQQAVAHWWNSRPKMRKPIRARLEAQIAEMDVTAEG